MPRPIPIAHTHVHSMRTASGEEALVARVLTADGVAGFGFTLNFEAIVAREMAAWDAAARVRNVPFHALFGGKTRERVEVVVAQAGAVIDPFTGEPLADLRRRAQESKSVAFLAPHAHPWEIGWCAALAATLAGELRIAVRTSSAPFVAVSDAAGIGVDWSAEPAFASLRWSAG